MGRRIRMSRRGAGSIFATNYHHRIGAIKLRPLDYSERNGYIRGVVTEIKHESGRGAPIASVSFRNTDNYGHDQQNFLACEGMYTGQSIYCGKTALLENGNVLPLAKIPEGTNVCNVEQYAGCRGNLARTSGVFAQVISHNQETGKTRIKLPSSRKLVVPSAARAMIGIVAGGGRTEKPLLKAGVAYHKAKANGRKTWPVVRAVAMNPVDHPHGGGNHQHVGHSTTVNRHRVSGQKVGLVAARQSGAGGSLKKFNRD